MNIEDLLRETLSDMAREDRRPRRAGSSRSTRADPVAVASPWQRRRPSP